MKLEDLYITAHPGGIKVRFPDYYTATIGSFVVLYNKMGLLTCIPRPTKRR